MKNLPLSLVVILVLQAIATRPSPGQDFAPHGSFLGIEDEEAFFGIDIDLSDDGTIMAVGFSDVDAPEGENMGAFRVYEWDGDDWAQMGAEISGGALIALSGDGLTLAATPAFDLSNFENERVLRIYRWDGNEWAFLGDPITGDAATSTFPFQAALSKDGLTVVAGYPTHGPDEDNPLTGLVRVYRWDGTSWTQAGSDIDGLAPGHVTGWDVDISADGNVIAVLAPGLLSGLGDIRVFEWDGLEWTQQGETVGGLAGVAVTQTIIGLSSLSLSDNGMVIAIGLPGTSSPRGFVNAGAVRVFEWTGSAWIRRGDNVPGQFENGNFGLAVELSSNGDAFVSGSIRSSFTSFFDGSGEIRVIEWDGSEWTPGSDTRLRIEGDDDGEQFGFSVAMSADASIVAAGAPNFDGTSTDNGQVRVYAREVVPDATDETGPELPTDVQLAGNYPNPFSGATTIEFDLSHAMHVRLEVLDALGRPVQSVVNAWLPAGRHSHRVTLNSSPGVYFYRLITPESRTTRPMHLLN